MFRFLSVILMIVFAVIHVDLANSMKMDGDKLIVVLANSANQKFHDPSDVMSPVPSVDCWDEQNNSDKSKASHCQIDCGLVCQQIKTRTHLQIRDMCFALGNFTISNEPCIPLRPPIA